MPRIKWSTFISIILAAFIFYLAGCGGSNQSVVPSSGGSDAASSVSSSTVVQTPGALWEISSEAVTDEGASSRAVTTAPTLTSPINGQEVVKSQGVTFKWSAVSGATSYMISISQSSAYSGQFTSLSDSRGGSTQKTFATISASQPDGTYYWRVRASDKARPKTNRDSDWGPYSSSGNLKLVSTTASACGTTTTGTIKGTVTDATTNNAISAASVELDSNQTTTTDGNGKYSISNVTLGLHSGVVKKSGYLSAAIEANVTAKACVEVNPKLQPSGSSGGPPPPPIFP